MLTLERNTPVNYTKRDLWDLRHPGWTYKEALWRIEPGRCVLPDGMTATEAAVTGTPTTAGNFTIGLGREVDWDWEPETLLFTVPGAPPPPDPGPGSGSGGALAARMVAFLGAQDDDDVVALAAVHTPIMTTMVKSYTRGRGFDEYGYPNVDLETVILAAGARLVVNPEQSGRLQIGDYSEVKAVFNGWTLAELAVLNRYRRRSA